MIIRFLDGASDAASWGAVLGILMKIWPDRVASIMSWTEMFFGLGYTIGKLNYLLLSSTVQAVKECVPPDQSRLHPK